MAWKTLTYQPGRGPWGPQTYYEWVPDAAPTPIPPPPAPALPPAPEPIDPKELASVLYGQNIPIAISSRAQYGGRIIEGPEYLTIGGENCVSFIIGYYIPINYETTGRTVTELWIRGERAWTQSGGSSLANLFVGGPTTGTEQRVRFTNGTLGQTADQWSINKYGDAAVAYVPMVTGTFENIRIAQFGNIVPFTSVTVQDTQFGAPGDQIPWEDVLNSLATYDGRRSFLYGIDKFEAVDVLRGVEALILGSPTDFPTLLAGFRKVKPSWHIRTEDKLYVVEKSNVALDVEIEMRNVQARGADPVTINLLDAKENNQEVILSYLDSGADYERRTVRAAMELDPIRTTDAFQSETINVPVVSTMDEMIVDANLALFSKDVARCQADFTGLAPYIGLQPGDALALPTDERDYYQIIRELVRKVDFTVEVKAEAFLTCAGSVAIISDGGESEDSPGPYTFAAGLGAAAADRVIVAVVTASTNNRTITGVTIDGTPMTLHVATNGAGVGAAFFDPVVGIASLPWPTGTTATFVLTLSGLAEGATITVYRLVNMASSVPHATASYNGVDDQTTTLAIPTRGVVVAGYAGGPNPANTGTVGSVGWTGLLRDVSFKPTMTSTNYWLSTAAQRAMRSQAARTIGVVSPAHAGRELLVAVSWQGN